jgi:hypothetical protein
VRLVDKLALVSSGVGLLGGAGALWLGLRHNPQGEFFLADSGRVDFKYCAMVFGAWFAVVGVATLVVALAVTGVVRALRRP